MMRHISVIAASADAEASRIQRAIERVWIADGGRDGLEVVLGRLLAEPANTAPATLDLIGHSSSGESVLVFGDWPIDATRPSVRSFFRGLADEDVLGRLGVSSLRLLGCQTAATVRARDTICTLAEILGIDVFGTSQMIHASHYERTGFRDDCTNALVRARDLEPEERVFEAVGRRTLDIEMLPSSPLGEWRLSWARKVVDLETGRALLRLVDREHGAQMPFASADPICELALPAIGRPGWYYALQVLSRHEFVRVYPDGGHRAGYAYRVVDPDALRALLGA